MLYYVQAAANLSAGDPKNAITVVIKTLAEFIQTSIC